MSPDRNPRFDLDKAIAAWRRNFIYNRVFFREDLDELESHLRDHVEALHAAGWSDKAAFGAALDELGDYGHTEQEYRKVFWAKLKYRRGVLHELTWYAAMLKNYLIIASRNLRKHKGYALINIVGLSTAIAAALLLLLFIEYERSYDGFHDHLAHIYRIGEYGDPNEPISFRTRALLLPAVLDKYPAAVSGTRTFEWGFMVTYDNKRSGQDGYYVDSTFFDVFSFPLVAGDPATALRRKDGVVLSETLARKIFGDEDPLGKALTLDFTQQHVVTGVLTYPANSTLKPDLLVPYVNIEPRPFLNWSNTLMPAYVRLAEQTDPAALEPGIGDLIRKHHSEQDVSRIKLFPFGAYHLQVGPQGFAASDAWAPGLSPRALQLYVLAALALAIVLIAAINFTNLATARSLSRVREIGMRKVLGAERKQLVGQFLGEALVLTYLASVVGIAIAKGLVPVFNELVETHVELNVLSVLTLLNVLFVGTGVGLLAGSYPALHLSRFNPTEAIRGTFQHNPRGRQVRNGLVVLQFVLSVMLIIGMAVVWQQITFMKTGELHVDTERILSIQLSPYSFEDADVAFGHITTMKQELLRHSHIQAVSSSKSVPGNYVPWGGGFEPEGWTGDKTVWARWTPVDDQYFDLYGMTLREGRTFSDSLATDVRQTAVINQTAMRTFGWTTGAGKVLRVGDRDIEVIGVVNDFHYQSLQHEIEPLVHYCYGPDDKAYSLLSIKIGPGPLQPVVRYIEDKLHALDPAQTFEYAFVDEQFNDLYAQVERRGQLIGVAALLAVLIACLGLLGLASYASTQRIKEIGIRKVLGATISNIVLLLSKDFARLMVIAFVLAAPLAYLATNLWLEDFAYHIETPWLTFVIAGVAALVIALVTVSYHAMRAALADPAQTLRYE